jgi:hypothetical protein
LRLDRFGQCSFFGRDRFAGTHELDVCHADVCNDRRIRRGDLRERCDFAGMIHPDLPDGNFILGSRFQNCAWQAYVIVEIPFGLGDPKSSREHRRGEILRARLAIASSDRDHAQSERSPVIRSEFLVRF